MLATDVQLHLFRNVFGEKLFEHLCYNVVGRPMLSSVIVYWTRRNGGWLFVSLGEGRILNYWDGIWHKVWNIMTYEDSRIRKLYDLSRINVQILEKPLRLYLWREAATVLFILILLQWKYLFLRRHSALTDTWRPLDGLHHLHSALVEQIPE